MSWRDKKLVQFEEFLGILFIWGKPIFSWLEVHQIDMHNMILVTFEELIGLVTFVKASNHYS